MEASIIDGFGAERWQWRGTPHECGIVPGAVLVSRAQRGVNEVNAALQTRDLTRRRAL
jgi:hypothetical protein